MDSTQADWSDADIVDVGDAAKATTEGANDVKATAGEGANDVGEGANDVKATACEGASDLGEGANAVDVRAWLDSHGLTKYADTVLEVSDAEHPKDFLLCNVEDLIAQAGLKLVSAEKMRRAVAALAPADKTADAAPAAAPPKLQEATAICIDRSGSMGAPFAELVVNVVEGARQDRTRMEAVKAMFYAFRDRIDALSTASSHQLGLLQFDDHVETLLGLTDRLDKFEAIVDDMKRRGTTAIFSAIIEAVRMLEPVFRESQSTDLRVLCLTDGMSNAGASPQEALAAANEIGAVVDAIIVGDRPDGNLRKIVAATGGLCFQINNLGEGFELLEGEGVASLRARRGGGEKPAFVARPPVEFASIEEKSFAMSAPVARPADPLRSQKVVDVARRVEALDSGGGASAAGGGGLASKRVLKELRDVAAKNDSVWLHSGEGTHIFPSESDLTRWRALIEGPAGSPFEGGVFSLSVSIPEQYPMRPPAIRFETPVYHCNVNDSGSICLGLLQESWSPALSVPKALEAVRLMLKQPDTDNALRQWIAELTIASKSSGGSDTRYVDEARARTRKDAARSVAEWRQEWGASA